MSADVPPMDRADFRLPADLKARVQREANEAGIDFSEFVRQALALRLAWTDALRAVQAGADPTGLQDVERVTEHLRRLGEGGTRGI